MSAWRSFRESLEIGAHRPLLVRRERLTPMKLGRRILFASDLHLHRDGPGHIVEGLLDIVLHEHPDVILLGGDLVDWRTGLPALREIVSSMVAVAPVAAIGGNHDRWVGLTRVREAVREGGGHWLEDEPLLWAPGAAVYGSPESQRLRAECHILCSHHPRPVASHHRFDLVLSGHIHGGQFVFFEHNGRLYPGAFLYRWNGLRFHENGTTLLVSRGVRDTFPLRWNCPREVIVVDL
ncbi:MAG TPA: metallophosphoesterase [Terriglobia bacterium]|nr:metallophosphoesterase [Terriglobia bacterium]